MNHRISKKNKLKHFYKPILFGVIIAIIVSYFIVLIKGGDLTLMIKVFLGIFIFGLFLFDFPLIIFFINYVNNDKNISLVVDKSENNLIFKNENKEIELSKNDIYKVIMFLPPALFDERITLLHWDEYFYYEVISSKGNFKITFLVISNLESYFPEEKIERKKVYFPLIHNSKKNN